MASWPNGLMLFAKKLVAERPKSRFLEVDKWGLACRALDSSRSDLPQGLFGYAVYLRSGLRPQMPQVWCMAGIAEGPGCARQTGSMPYDGIHSDTTTLIENR